MASSGWSYKNGAMKPPPGWTSREQWRKVTDQGMTPAQASKAVAKQKPKQAAAPAKATNRNTSERDEKALGLRLKRHQKEAELVGKVKSEKEFSAHVDAYYSKSAKLMEGVSKLSKDGVIRVGKQLGAYVTKGMSKSTAIKHIDDSLNGTMESAVRVSHIGFIK